MISKLLHHEKILKSCDFTKWHPHLTHPTPTPLTLGHVDIVNKLFKKKCVRVLKSKSSKDLNIV